MQKVDEMSKVFWRHGTTVHMRIFELPECKAIQWWHSAQNGVIYIAKNDSFTPHFDGKVLTCERPIQHAATALPPVPAPIDTAQFHNDLKNIHVPSAKQVLEHTKVVSNMLELTKSTSGNELSKQLKLHRAKHKLQAVLRFKNN